MKQSTSRILLAVIAIVGVIIIGFLYFSTIHGGAESSPHTPQNEAVY